MVKNTWVTAMPHVIANLLTDRLEEAPAVRVALKWAEKGHLVYPLVAKGAYLFPLDEHPTRPPENLATTNPAEIQRLFQSDRFFVGVLIGPTWHRVAGEELIAIPTVQGTPGEYEVKHATVSPTSSGGVTRAECSADTLTKLRDASLLVAQSENTLKRLQEGLARAQQDADRLAELHELKAELASMHGVDEAAPYLDQSSRPSSTLASLKKVDREIDVLEAKAPDQAAATIARSITEAKSALQSSRQRYDVLVEDWLLKVERPKAFEKVRDGIDLLRDPLLRLIAVEDFTGRAYNVGASKMFDSLRSTLPIEAQPPWLRDGLKKLPGRRNALDDIQSILREMVSK
mgnify:CR=1 FL=1